MTTLSEVVRRATTFLLAAFLWLHALFCPGHVNVHSVLLSRSAEDTGHQVVNRLSLGDRLGVGIGTIVNFLRRRLDDIRTAATDLSDRFADQSVREKYIILEQKFGNAATSGPAR